MKSSKSVFMHLSREEQKTTLEALIFAADEALPLKLLHKILLQREEPAKYNAAELFGEDGQIAEPAEATAEALEAVSDEDNRAAEITLNDIAGMIAEINDELAIGNRPFHIVHLAGGYQFATKPEYGYLIAQLNKTKQTRKLSQAALEALSIIAYKQPVSKPEIEQIRGVNSNEIVNSLIDKNLVKIVGRSQALGKPLLFGTTNDFLKTMGLKDIGELPKLRELEDLTNFDKYQINPDKTLTLNIEDIDVKTEDIDAKTEVIDAKTEVIDVKTEVIDAKTEVIDAKTEVIDAKQDKSSPSNPSETEDNNEVN